MASTIRSIERKLVALVPPAARRSLRRAYRFRSAKAGVTARGEKLHTRSLEINVTTHCNLKCYGCGRGSPAYSEESISVTELAADLAALSRVLHAREFRLAGGEPLQHPGILDIADVVRDSGVADEIVLITNGVLLHQAPEELWKKIDKIWVSIYPGVARKMTREEIFSLGERHGVKVWFKVTDSFERRMLNRENRDPSLVRQIYSGCYQTQNCHSIYGGRYFKCASGPLVPRWLQEIGTERPDFTADGVPLRDNDNLRADLEAYLASDEPLVACRYCLGGVGKAFAHRQLNAEGVRDWLSEDHSDVEQLIDPARLTAVGSPLAAVSSVLSHVGQGLLRAVARGTRSTGTK